MLCCCSFRHIRTDAITTHTIQIYVLIAHRHALHVVIFAFQIFKERTTRFLRSNDAVLDFSSTRSLSATNETAAGLECAEATNKISQSSSLNQIQGCWWRMTGSNRRPPACKAGALPAELIPQTASRVLVGQVGIEPTTPALSRRCSNRLSY